MIYLATTSKSTIARYDVDYVSAVRDRIRLSPEMHRRRDQDIGDVKGSVNYVNTLEIVDLAKKRTGMVIHRSWIVDTHHKGDVTRFVIVKVPKE